MRENTLRNAPLDGLSITLTWSIPENPPSQGPEDFFSNYQLRFKDSQPDSSIICIVKNDGWSTGDYPYSYQLQNEREGISFDLDVDRFRIDMTKPDNYSNWDSFASVIESGIDILLQALNKTVGATCFDSVSIRYDDWFPTEITGRDSSHFIRDVLGFSIALPDRIDEGFPSKGDESVQAYVNRHLAGCGLDATIKVADMTRIAGRHADPSRAGVALMMQISNRSSIDTDLRSVMDSLSEEHDIAHRMFFTLIEPIRDTFGVGEDQ